MCTQKYISSPQSKQTGASLIVALVLISVSALVGISVMQNGGLAEQLVSNDQYRQVAFRAGESAAGVILNQDNIATLSQNNSNSCLNSTDSIETHIAVTTELCPSGFGLAEGFRIGEGIPGFQMSHFYATSSASIDGVEARNTVVRGAQHLSVK